MSSSGSGKYRTTRPPTLCYWRESCNVQPGTAPTTSGDGNRYLSHSSPLRNSLRSIPNPDPQDPGANSSPLKRPSFPLWMSPQSDWLVDTCTDLRRKPLHKCNMDRGATKSMRQYLLVDSWRQSGAAATEIGVCLEPVAVKTNICRVYTVLKCWYRNASARAPNPPWTNT